MSMYNSYTRGGNSVVECLLAKEDVASSSLVSRSIKKKKPKGFFFFALNRLGSSRLFELFGVSEKRGFPPPYVFASLRSHHTSENSTPAPLKKRSLRASFFMQIINYKYLLHKTTYIYLIHLTFKINLS